jgi:fatty-acyl-CoA synthase
MHPTPTTSDNLSYRRADFATLTEALDYAARGRTGLNFYSGRGELTATLPYSELRERALAAARGLIRSGLPPRARMLLVADTDPDFAVLFMACQYAGLLPVPVAVPTSLGGREAYVGQLRRQLASSGAAAAAAPAPLLPFLEEAAEGLGLALVGTPADFYALPGEGSDPRPFGPSTSPSAPCAATATRSRISAWTSCPAIAASPGCPSTTTWGWSASCWCRSSRRCRSTI